MSNEFRIRIDNDLTKKLKVQAILDGTPVFVLVKDLLTQSIKDYLAKQSTNSKKGRS